jgi:hypothetical protein
MLRDVLREFIRYYSPHEISQREQWRAIDRALDQAQTEITPLLRKGDYESVQVKLDWWNAYLREHFGPGWYKTRFPATHGNAVAAAINEVPFDSLSYDERCEAMDFGTREGS